MRIVGTNPSLGDWKPSFEKKQMTARVGNGLDIQRNGNPVKMYRSEKKYEWLTQKYGADVRPWECQVILENKDWQNTLKNELNKIHYTYSLKNDFHVDIS